ncbi:MAG: hypothetical protein A3E82_05535 [Gammaproteobacteria bacterium RIFCSPHIGHO2_12_FULL_38_11]|nr:MAG: hypothetical protein A3E82_05535 [Gammaproteobacteria bacterium RIFCSPHIGHO2_12_FULL_38_11]
MPKTNFAAKSLPFELEQLLKQLGRNIRIARLRRNLRIEDLAERVGVSRYVISHLEKGKPTVAIVSYFGALWAMGLIGDLQHVGDPDRDEEGLALENARAPKTAAKRKKVLDNDF